MKDLAGGLIMLELVFTPLAGAVYLNYGLYATALPVQQHDDCRGNHHAAVPKF